MKACGPLYFVGLQLLSAAENMVRDKENKGHANLVCGVFALRQPPCQLFLLINTPPVRKLVRWFCPTCCAASDTESILGGGGETLKQSLILDWRCQVEEEHLQEAIPLCPSLYFHSHRAPHQLHQQRSNCHFGLAVLEYGKTGYPFEVQMG